MIPLRVLIPMLMLTVCGCDAASKDTATNPNLKAPQIQPGRADSGASGQLDQAPPRKSNRK